MKLFSSILQVLISVVFLFAGFGKMTTPYDILILEPNMSWAVDFTSFQILAIGCFEIVMALLLFTGLFWKLLNKITPLIGALFAVQMVAAMVVHIGRNETQSVYVNIVILLFTLTFAIIRFNLNSKTA